MSNINPFILTGMMPLSASSMNRVSYMCPVTISNDVVQGQTDIQDSLTVDSGGNLYIINAPVYVGGPNQPDHGHRTAHLVIRNGGISIAPLDLLADKRYTLHFLFRSLHNCFLHPCLY